MAVAKDNDLVLLVSRDRKQFLVTLQAGNQLQTHRGCIQHDDLLGKPVGREILSHLGYPFVALRPSTADLISRLRRTTQIMYPKDIGYTLLKLDVQAGSRVIEAGTGSGGLTVALGRAVGPSGRVYSYEGRSDILEVAQRNVAALGLADRIEFRLRDIEAGFDETDADAIFLDVRRPWCFLAQAGQSLASGGFFGAILPTTNQVAELVQGLEESDVAFGYLEVEEILLRSYKPVPSRLRPADRMIAHTGYLVFARKVTREVSTSDYWVDRRRRKHEERQTALQRLEADDLAEDHTAE